LEQGDNIISEHDGEKIMDVLNNEWAVNLANAYKRIAFLAEENRLLRAENEELRKGAE